MWQVQEMVYHLQVGNTGLWFFLNSFYDAKQLRNVPNILNLVNTTQSTAWKKYLSPTIFVYNNSSEEQVN